MCNTTGADIVFEESFASLDQVRRRVEINWINGSLQRIE
jgi:hypothetical protein